MSSVSSLKCMTRTFLPLKTVPFAPLLTKHSCSPVLCPGVTCVLSPPVADVFSCGSDVKLGKAAILALSLRIEIRDI